MIIIKQQHYQKPKRQRRKHPLHIQLPKRHQPPPWLRRIERPRNRHCLDPRVLEVAWDMREADPEDGREDVRVVCQEGAEDGFEDGTVAEHFEAVDG